MNTLRHRIESERGMTLVEILAVIVLLSLIMTFVVQAVSGRSEAAKAKLNEAKMGNLRTALANYRLEYGSFPSRLEELMTGGSAVKQAGKAFIALVKDAELKDIWNNPFLYEAQNNGRAYTLTSLGADGASGGTDVNQDVTVTGP